MITAAQAKELYEFSGVELKQFLATEVEPKVKEAASSGKRTITIHLGAIQSCYKPKLSPLQAAAIAELIKLGYRAECKVDHHSYVPRGLADDSGFGPSHNNYGIEIWW